ncbi:alpha/beta hydrolase-fold protein [Pseudarthrobacter sp. J75]|uniref:alpha/beta hydrolase n=1 Tax=unclassified Pseudarthrobacter TaxID=2647000 RepID=UPI002E80BC45|nr:MULTISPECIES: alpha/beta hydrolase-fold protein [unclassified Pseudarthrobacter]MEE2521476.1 alpha/beta hydrolase-fold protein [Pseudarthrobacter sp. J47]MEE2528708.1 alpha/beta hydrolase-fold protein [Pseudarthrobacter sp. J75]
MELFADLRLTEGPVYWAAWLLGSAGALYLLWGRPKDPPLRRLIRPLAAGAAALAVVAIAHWAVVDVLSLLPDDVPSPVLFWVGIAVATAILLLMRVGRETWRRRAAGGTAFALVLLLSMVQVNSYFGLNRTLSDLFGTSTAGVSRLEPGLTRQADAPPLVPLAGWHPAGAIPGQGELRTASIPGTASGMNNRDAYIYLPPAYFAPNRPALPVLLLIAGQPGGPADWLTGGSLQSHMDSFAAAHGGLAPVVVVADPNGSQSGNTMCMDSRIAKADTYLSQDVPRWITSTLAVDPDHRQWAAGGFSFGATCAVQLGTRHPDLYKAVLAFSSEAEPAIAKERHKTIDASFPGDPAAFERQTPLAIMAANRFEGSGMYLTAGAEDPEFAGYLRTLAAAAENSGFSVQAHIVEDAGHSWDTSSKRFADAMAFLAARWGLG